MLAVESSYQVMVGSLVKPWISDRTGSFFADYHKKYVKIGNVYNRCLTGVYSSDSDFNYSDDTNNYSYYSGEYE